jgi:hypothetical protein
MTQAIPAPPPQFWLQDEFDALASGIIYYCNLPVILTAGIVVAIIYAAAWARGKKILGVVASFVLLGVSAYEYFTSFRDIRK